MTKIELYSGMTLQNVKDQINNTEYKNDKAREKSMNKAIKLFESADVLNNDGIIDEHEIAYFNREQKRKRTRNIAIAAGGIFVAGLTGLAIAKGIQANKLKSLLAEKSIQLDETKTLLSGAESELSKTKTLLSEATENYNDTKTLWKEMQRKLAETLPEGERELAMLKSDPKTLICGGRNVDGSFSRRYDFDHSLASRLGLYEMFEEFDQSGKVTNVIMNFSANRFLGYRSVKGTPEQVGKIWKYLLENFSDKKSVQEGLRFLETLGVLG